MPENLTEKTYKAGFVHILGKPNAGKSTLFNTLIPTPLSITTHKAQTTRQDIIGIHNAAEHQIIYVDTPGYMVPTYALQKTMLNTVKRAMVDSDLLLWIVDIRDKEPDYDFFKRLQKHQTPLFLLLNKIDLIAPALLPATLATWQKKVNITPIPICAHSLADCKLLTEKILPTLPFHPPYYAKDALTDKPIRFFVSEIIRKQLFLQYIQEVPYSTQVQVTSYKEKEDIIHIKCEIYVERLSQKKILIGKQGKALKQVGIAARKELESFLNKKVFLAQHVRVLPDWRKNTKILAGWGYV